MAIDPRLVGIWREEQGFHNIQEIRSDGKEFTVSSNGLFVIDTTKNPEQLTLKDSKDVRDRVGGTPGTGILGLWNDRAYMEPDGNTVHEIYYRPDHTYIDKAVSGPLYCPQDTPTTGDYTVTGGVNEGQIEHKSLLGIFTTNGSRFLYRLIDMPDESGTLVFSNGNNTVTFEYDPPGGPWVYHRLP
ncbi:hypothetical protein D8Y20_07240 [Mariprofundus sp. EBB-1]|uniref:hypothetical protein n=1 Tax=Mariprofundus sp. EBB-1 TaxID=2650971 RepID=UPI000EF25721|nr:hypothetical protein [Mariprofundus sp. EBB-1]RLL52300.1 hypothetical protein D8Y20_07240 [Mariprofundus sp. EBB-1]